MTFIIFYRRRVIAERLASSATGPRTNATAANAEDLLSQLSSSTRCLNAREGVCHPPPPSPRYPCIFPIMYRGGIYGCCRPLQLDPLEAKLKSSDPAWICISISKTHSDWLLCSTVQGCSSIVAQQCFGLQACRSFAKWDNCWGKNFEVESDKGARKGYCVCQLFEPGYQWVISSASCNSFDLFQ